LLFLFSPPLGMLLKTRFVILIPVEPHTAPGIGVFT